MTDDPRSTQLAQECAENEHDCPGTFEYGTHTEQNETVQCACPHHRCDSCDGTGFADWAPGQQRDSEDDQQPCPDCAARTTEDSDR